MEKPRLSDFPDQKVDWKELDTIASKIQYRLSNTIKYVRHKIINEKKSVKILEGSS